MQKYKVTNQISYAEAAKIVKESEIARSSVTHEVHSTREAEHRRLIEASSLAPCQGRSETNSCLKGINEDTLIVDKISFVAFICKTVNVAIQQKKKSDRIKTIVEAAVEILGIKEVTAELIHVMLNPSNCDGLSQGD